MKKCEIHLPLHYCDGEPIEQEKIGRVRDELVAAFGSFGAPNRRTWKYDGSGYVEIMRVEIIATDDKVTKRLLKEFKERFKQSLRQVDILITTQDIRFI